MFPRDSSSTTSFSNSEMLIFCMDDGDEHEQVGTIVTHDSGRPS